MPNPDEPASPTASALASTSIEEWSDRLSAYVDGEGSAAERAQVEAALAQSPELRAELEQLQSMMQALSGLREVKPTQGFAERVTLVAATGRRIQESVVQSLASMPLQLVGVAVVLVIGAAYFFLHFEVLRGELTP